MRRHIPLLLLFLICSLESMAQDMGKQIQENFAKFVPSEKLFLHTDKPDYFTGDTIWFKGYLVNSADIGRTLTNFIYVELMDAQNRIVVSKKIKRDSTDVFKGYIELDKSMDDNDYVIRSYTTWMQNFPKEYFFYKNLRIGTPSRKDIKTRASVSRVDSVFAFVVEFHRDGEGSLNGLPMECSIRNVTTGKGIKINGEKISVDSKLTLAAKGVNPGDVVMIDIKGKDGKGDFSNTLRVEIPKLGYDIQFLPEGGDLIGGDIRIIAYKAVASMGEPIDVSGYIVDNRNDTVAYIRDSHSGMGTVSFFADPHKSFTAYTYSQDSTLMVTPLPEVKQDGVALAVKAIKDHVEFTVNKVGVMSSQKLYVVLHSRGQMQYVMELYKDAVRHLIPLNELMPGISHFLIVNEKGQPLAERIFFVHPDSCNISLVSEKAFYSPRQEVILSMTLPDELKGNFSISVTDDKFVKADDDYDNIVSNLLLTSDLHGSVENPAQYIDSPLVDLVMLTNGWRRFNVAEIIQGVKQETPFYIEAGQTIRGNILSPYKKNVAESKIFAQIYSTDSTSVTMINKDGSFEIGNLDIGGIKKLSLTAIHPKNKTLDASIKIDTTSVTPKSWSKRLFQGINNNEDLVFETKVQQVFDSLGFTGKNHALDEVVVKGRLPWRNVYEVKDPEPGRLSDKMSLYSSSFNDYVKVIYPNITLKDILTYNGLWPGIGNSPRITGLLYILDGLKIDSGEAVKDGSFTSLIGRDISAIEIIYPPRSIIYDFAGRTIVVIETVFSNPNFNRITAKNSLTFDLKGYDKYEKEFYSPKYVANQSGEYSTLDYRTTIYWNPSVNLSGEKAEIKFYASDDVNTTYNVLIEGVTTDNKPISKCFKIVISGQ